MASAAIAARPVHTLRELFATLEAVINAALADPKPKAVHYLRTTTRRIEAQLELLSLLSDLPKHTKPKKKARKLLRRLRRAASRVRDLDVQDKLTQSKSRKPDPEVHQLRSTFKRQRDEETEHLLRILRKHQSKLPRLCQTLLEALAPAEALTLPNSRLAQLTLRWYVDHVPVTVKSPDELHTIRKVAKLARYMAESASLTAKSRAARTPAADLARTFESLQQSGGAWHDWLTLSHIARSELGPSSRLAQSFGSRCEESLAYYQRHLKSMPKDLSIAAPNPKALV